MGSVNFTNLSKFMLGLDDFLFLEVRFFLIFENYLKNKTDDDRWNYFKSIDMNKFWQVFIRILLINQFLYLFIYTKKGYSKENRNEKI